ncbi:hypothetical protein ACHAWF_010910 [Thalassiosira exigua]
MFCHDLGFKDEVRSENQARPHFGILCCNSGKIILDQYPLPPQLLLELFTASTPLGVYFQKNIRMFNAGVVMASVQVNNATMYNGRNVSAFKVSRESRQRVGPLTARTGSTTYNCVQTYFLHPTYQYSYRSTRYNGSLLLQTDANGKRWGFLPSSGKP